MSGVQGWGWHRGRILERSLSKGVLERLLRSHYRAPELLWCRICLLSLVLLNRSNLARRHRDAIPVSRVTICIGVSRRSSVRCRVQRLAEFIQGGIVDLTCVLRAGWPTLRCCVLETTTVEAAPLLRFLQGWVPRNSSGCGRAWLSGSVVPTL